MPEGLPEGVERLVLVRHPGVVGWYVSENPHVGSVPGVQTKEVIFVSDLPAIIDQAKREERERLARRCEDVYAGLADLRRKREQQGKDNSAAYLQGRQHEASNQAAALRELETADFRANRFGDALAAVVTTARSWLLREHGDGRPMHPADDAAAGLFDALDALAALDHTEPQDEEER